MGRKQTGIALVLAALVTACSQGVVTEGDWPYIYGNTMGQRYSPLDQINAENFGQLEVAWVWDGSEFPNVNAGATPIYVNGKLISVAGEKRHVVATDPGTGETLWSWVEPETFRWEYSMRKNHGKGVAYANVDGAGRARSAGCAELLRAPLRSARPSPGRACPCRPFRDPFLLCAGSLSWT